MAHKTRPRLIYPGLWDSPKFCGLSDRAFRAWSFLLTQADDDGIGQYVPAIMGSRPFISAPLTPDETEAVRAEIEGCGLVEFYRASGASLYKMHDWNDFQSVRKDRYQPTTYCQPGVNQVSTIRQPTDAIKVKVKVKDNGNGNDSESPAAPGASAEAVRLTDLLAKRVRAWNAIAPIPEPGTPGRSKWEKAIDQLLRLGPPGSGVAVKPAQVEAVIHWIDTSAQGEFWRANILSAGALREKFPKLWGQRRRDLDKDNHADRAALDAAQTKRARKAAAEPERVGGGDLAAAGTAIAAVLGKLGGKE